MFKKIFSYPVFLVIVLSIIGSLFYGYLVKYFMAGGQKFIFLKDIIITSTEITQAAINMIQSKSFNPNKPLIVKRHKNKKRFEQFINNKRNALLILPRYDHSISRSVVDVIDLKNFETIHTYKHDIAEMILQIKNLKEFPRISIEDSPIRFRYFHPLILDDGSLISYSHYSVMFKIDFCSKLKWINDEERFHHSQMLNHEGSIWVGSQLNPPSKHVIKYQIDNFDDDSIVKIDTDGKILFKKSVIEILIDNKILPNNYAYSSSKSGERDPIHLNDIEPALSDSRYWEKGDIFLSIRNQSAIVHYRPRNNKIINYITGPFAHQHDVDIISKKEISIFNNNSFFVNNEFSEILIYNFETDEFTKVLNDQLQKEKFKTIYGGLSHYLKDGSFIVDEDEFARLILFNKKGEKEWEFINKDKNGNIGLMDWSRIIEDEFFIEKFKSLVENKKCTN